MKNTNKTILLYVFLLFYVLLNVTNATASLYRAYQKNIASFYKLQKNPKKAKYRDNWLYLKKKFLAIYKKAPKSSTGAKSLYYAGRVYEELGKISHLRSDFFKAIDYFRRVTLKYPYHSWADDAQFRIANIFLTYLHDPKQAYIELLKVIYNYPKGDMKKNAEQLLKKLDSQKLKKRKKLKHVNYIKKNKTKPQLHTSQLLKIRHWSSDEYTRVVLDLTAPVKYFYKLLNPDPKLNTTYRLFIDLQHTSITPHLSRQTNIADGILKRVRVAPHSQKTTRVVLDIQSIQDYRIFSLSNPFRIVVDVYGQNKKQAAKTRPINISSRLREKIARQNLIEQLGLRVKTIMLDPGHGGKDPGAISHGVKEKDINLKMAKILGGMLKAKGFRILYTRTKDVFIPLEERTALANSKKADLFISIHCNAHRNHKVKGLEIYYLNVTRSKDALRVAARENAVSAKKISDLQLILTELMLNSKISESRSLAKIVQKKAICQAKKRYAHLTNHGVREAPFYVLMGAKMPAILIELGYITNPEDRKKLLSSTYLKTLARGIVNGILAYKQRIENVASLY
ncbi:MAG: N-acetylmuramoyl-L-alanine amidase [Desulfonauticus sp.]|nr:N-acetylmuramoyl-L-alanine amidase [Desulfonauticus sp.]